MFVQRLILPFATSRIARQIIRYPKLWTRNGVEWEALRLLSNDKKPSNHRPKPSMIKHEVKKPSTNGNSNKSAVNNILHYLSAIKSAEGKEKIDLRASLDKQLQTTANYEIFLKEDEIISILQIISEANFYTTFYKGSKAFVKRLVFEISSPNSSFQDRVKLEILSLISRLRYNYIDLHPKDQLALRDVILGIKLTAVAKSFSQYADFFFLMASMTILWGDLPEQYRRLLLSSIKDLGEVDRFPLVSAERLIYSIDKLMIMKFHRGDMDVEVKQRYERLLERILQEKYKDDIVTENELQIAAVVMGHLSALAADRGQKGLGQQQMELICKGLLKEWKDMRLFDQCNTISMWGEISLDFTTLPEELRKHMMENLGSKVDEFGLKAGGLLCLLKGFVGMRLTWTEIDKSLQGAMIKEVKKLFGKKEN